MLTRREFAADTVGLAALALAPCAFGEKADRTLGVQLYTVRDLIEKDLPGTLAAIRRIGYRTVETIWSQYSIPARDLRRTILDAGLTAPSGHFGYDDLGSRFDYAKELGLKCMVCSLIPRAIAISADGYKRVAAQYNEWGAQASKLGLRFAFHNHNLEFVEYSGVTGLDILIANTDSNLVEWEMDCYWVAQAGHDPAEMLRKYGSRVQSLHLKDRKPNAPVSFDLGPGSAHFAEVGAGTLDWPLILRLAAENHISSLYVEQDQTDRSPLESLAISYANLMKLFAA
ncbi:MAG: sugar phosphate isomerase/epimerase family protein [Terracidiphilus sp.]